MINDVVRPIMDRYGIKHFFETGIYHAGTTMRVRDWFPTLDIYTVDCFTAYCDAARTAVPDAHVYAGDSAETIERLINQEIVAGSDWLFFLDAHGSYLDWPLLREIKQILRLPSPIIVIDDFKTPGTNFGYDTYGANECSINYVRSTLNGRAYRVYYAKEYNCYQRGCGIFFLDQENPAVNDLPLFSEAI